MILLLLLTLYAILGVSLFSTVKHSDMLNAHGNFHHFGWAFITLFRAVTGEAWNSIMHDLMKTETDFFREGSWCTPDILFDATTPEQFQLLADKCLIEKPNGCVNPLVGVNILPAVYWVTYILIICLMVMNLVIAVILEGYEDGKSSPETDVIDLCVSTWIKYDQDHKMTLPLPEALDFIHEVIERWKSPEKDNMIYGLFRPSGATASGIDLDRIPMKYANFFNLPLTEDGRVHWLNASKQVLRFTSTENKVELIREIEDCEEKLSQKELDRLKRVEKKRSKMLKAEAEDIKSVDMRAVVAATKLQRYFRQKSAVSQAVKTAPG